MCRVAVLACFCAGLVHAGDRDFDVIVRAMENQYGTKKLYIPLMGVANFFVKIARPAGTRDFKLAVFEGVDDRLHPSPDQLERVLRSRPGHGWSRFITVDERRSGERVHVYGCRSGKDHWELFLIALERREAVVMRLRLNPAGLAKWLDHPHRMARRQYSD
jgi:hypothetical protein